MDKTYDPKKVEPKWMRYWDKKSIYKFNPKLKKPVYSIDTPPRYASGDLHMGHAKNYTEFEIIARYKRMRGFNVYFPIGFDDNGLPTEKYVEHTLKVSKKTTSRAEFIKLCEQSADKMIKTMKETFNMLGFSYDWSTYYHTIDKYSQKQAQRSFIELYKSKNAYKADEPTLWCVHHQTALAQAEVEDATRKTSLNYIYFTLNGKKLEIATTRPELLPSCVAVFVHPKDIRYKKIVGKKAVVPIFKQKVPILTDESVDMDFGSGIVMCCTFGDTQDTEWWKVHKLPLKISINPDGTMNKLAKKYEGLKINEARKKIIDDLKKDKIIFKQQELKQTVGVCWRCDNIVEFIPTEQWFISALKYKDPVISLGKKVNWYPSFYRKRFEDWVKNLKWDWCISRQRYFGVPFPVWYCKKCKKIILADEKDLPVDPRLEKYKGKCKCGGEIIGEQDVMDTWMTSSLTPQIATKWEDDQTFFKKMFPMTLRPQAHDIIRTWAYYTMLKSYLHHASIPWKDVMISGYVYERKGVAMSSSKKIGENPRNIIEKHGADVLRYWATGAGLGEDLIYREQEIQRGKKILIKLWNASRFVSSFTKSKPKKAKLRTIDKWLITKLNRVIKQTTDYMDNYKISMGKRTVENFFMNVFCDQYLELVKYRLYQDKDKGAALHTLYYGLEAILKIYAPFIPFITEEIYNAIFKKNSIHLENWPKTLSEHKASERIGDKVVYFINEARKYKTQNKLPMSAELRNVIITSDIDLIDSLEDLKQTIKAKKISINVSKKNEITIH